MSTARVLDFISVDEYLEGEKTSPVKHEYVHGRVFALAGASDKHVRIVINLTKRLDDASQQKGCWLYTTDMKVRIPEGRFYYPDLLVTCEQENDAYYKEHPCLIVEVLSPSTRSMDRREKAEAYFTLPSLTAYLMVDSQTQHIEGYIRTSEGWKAQTWHESEEVEFGCLETSLRFSDIYAGL